MASSFRTRIAPYAVVAALVLALTPARAPAAVDMVVGPRHVVSGAPVSDCNQKAQSALATVLSSPFGSAESGQWEAYGLKNPLGKPEAAAAIHCYPLDSGYLVTITCAVQLPTVSQMTATDLCNKVDAAFGVKATALRATTGGASWR